jgi:hypothetical protein
MADELAGSTVVLQVSGRNVDPDLFRTSNTGPHGTGSLPGLEPSKPSPDEGWEDHLRRLLPDEMIEDVDWSDAERPEDVWEQLEENYDDPVGYASTKSDLI